MDTDVLCLELYDFRPFAKKWLCRIGNQAEHHFASSWSEDGYGTVQSFGRSVVHGTIVNYEVWGGVVPGSHETKIAVDDKIVEPQALKKLDGRIYFLYSEGDRQP